MNFLQTTYPFLLIELTIYDFSYTTIPNCSLIGENLVCPSIEK
jgi:hypothetical protein